MNAQTAGQVRPEDVESSKALTQSRIQSINAVNVSQLTSDKVVEYVDGFMQQALNDFRGNQIDGGQYAQISQAAIAKKQQAQQAAQTIKIPTQEMVSPKAPAKSRFPKIDPVFQTMLGVNPDGALGPMTQSALDRYKATIGMPQSSNELTFEALKREPQYKTRQAIPYDDNSNTYQVTREKEAPQVPPNPYEAQKTWGV